MKQKAAAAVSRSDTRVTRVRRAALTSPARELKAARVSQTGSLARRAAAGCAEQPVLSRGAAGERGVGSPRPDVSALQPGRPPHALRSPRRCSAAAPAAPGSLPPASVVRNDRREPRRPDGATPRGLRAALRPGSVV